MTANLQMYWPLILVVLANTFYNIAAKSVPGGASPWAVLASAYLVSSFLSFLAFLVFDENKNFIQSVRKLDWTVFALAASMVGLEAGYIFIYRYGWKISVASLLSNILLAIILLLIGLVAYKERLSVTQFLGVALCVSGCALLIIQK